jgi:hypothetical protein
MKFSATKAVYVRVVVGTCCSKEENICNVFRYFSFCSVPVTSSFVSAISFVKRSCSWSRNDLNSVSWFYTFTATKVLRGMPSKLV